ncbi:microfibril-associated glycoprotein 4-like [Clytia hemisphaerica]|uniref:microfibril-associated glycoprotein 4-like n=1 Tax=Clytia hemisphaerica TaxID=252671 RepID=UPI0034D6A53A
MMKKGIVLSITLILLLVIIEALETDQCGPKDSYFVKSNKGWEIGTGSWSDSFKVDNEIQCPSRCHRVPKCVSAAFYVDTKICRLSDTNRMTVNAALKLVPGIVYYERKLCSSKKTSFIAIIPSAKDCTDIKRKGWKSSGVYAVGEGENPRQILCEMSLLDGGWTVFQERVDDSVSFQRNWADYKEGFGSLDGNLWYGNDQIHNLTWYSEQGNELLIEMVRPNNQIYYLLYDGFKVAAESDDYRLTSGNYRNAGIGTVINGYFYGLGSHDQMRFSTIDRDNDIKSTEHCGQNRGSGFWFNYCFFLSLNGMYGSQYSGSPYRGIHWTYLCDGPFCETLISTRMMTRRKQ